METHDHLLYFYRSPGHNFVGHHGGPPGSNPVIESGGLECLAGRGVRGDRYMDHKADYKGQITFFASEVYRSLCREFQRFDRSPSVFRRNVITMGIDLNALVGLEFVLQGIRFLGTEICKPCHWMEDAFGPGAEAALHNRGGLRARILSSGMLRRGPAALMVRSDSSDSMMPGSMPEGRHHDLVVCETMQIGASPAVSSDFAAR